nr:hypothetical protein [Marseillevirus cajuinensis]WRK65361.1 hypothetical protein MarFTME_316 [Marseillevirus futianmevirus]
MATRFFALLDQDDIDSLFEDYYDEIKNSTRPIKEKKGIILFVNILLQCEAPGAQDKELIESLKGFDVPKFMDIMRQNKKYKELLYSCSGF